MKYAEVQKIAKDTIEFIKTKITAGMKLTDIRQLCEDKMLELGADSFWYWDIGAFVFSGDETTVSVSGREYITSDRKIASDDIITIDLSPQNNNIWGDYARTLIIEDGSVVDDINNIRNDEWRAGLLMEEELHKELIAFATPQTTFEELYYHINKHITDRGFINLDFLGNLGHSIVKDKNNRIYTEKGNKALLSSVDYFTFEPHISVPNSKYGYKKENIYYFNSGKLIEL
ncbi:M24 family metallopeptidase [Ruminococcus sp.]|uniref:M24 family metallopeptidase n=1 Tax=Ruminococcus sp. TaxID=41978 RepID=UPI0025F2E33D|nr:M24 family metallopeptidase [Ruminococcus sp.]